jgi:hypothetical protein
MQDDNPYAAPQTVDLVNPLVTQPPRVEGAELIASMSLLLPPRCVFCNKPTFPLSPIPLLLIDKQRSSQIIVRYFLCDRHRKQFAARYAIVGLFVLAIPFLVALFEFAFGDVLRKHILLVFACFLTVSGLAIVAIKFLKLPNIHGTAAPNGEFFINGICPEYRQELEIELQDGHQFSDAQAIQILRELADKSIRDRFISVQANEIVVKPPAILPP